MGIVASRVLTNTYISQFTSLIHIIRYLSSMRRTIEGVHVLFEGLQGNATVALGQYINTESQHRPGPLR